MDPSKLDALIAFFETLTPQSLERLGEFYAPNARFKDPFNDVRGQSAIRRIFARMFATLEAPRFVVLDTVGTGQTTCLRWNFHFRRDDKAWVIHGMTRLVWSGDGLITEHIDYWDAAGELYEKLPLLGPVLRWLKRHLAA